MTWIHVDESKPTKAGKYPVVIEGETERDGPHVFYDYDDYVTLMKITIDEDGINGIGSHDEDWEQVIYWMPALPPIPKSRR